MSNKKFIDELLQKARTKKFQDEQSKGLIQSIGEEIRANLSPKNLEDVAVNMGEQIKDSLVKSLEGVTANLNERIDSKIDNAIKGINISTPNINVPEVKVTIPEIKIPTINVPEPRVTVNVPDFPKIPDFPAIEMPNSMEVFGTVGLLNDYKNPLPVRLVTLDGKPYEAIFGGGSGGGVGSGRSVVTDILTSSGSSLIDNDGFLKVTGAFSATLSGSTTVTIANYDGLAYNSDNPLPVTFSAASVQPVSQVSGQSFSVFSTVDTTQSLYNADNRLRVSLETGGSGLTDSELRASHIDVQQLSGNIDSVSVKEIFGSTITTGVVNSDNRIRVSVETGGSGLTDSELRASHLDVQQLSGTIDSVYLTGIFGTVGVVTINPDGSPTYSSASSGLTDTELRATSVPVSQVSGVSFSVNVLGTSAVSVTDIFGSVGSNIVNPDGRLKVELPTGSSGLTDTELRATSLTIQQLSGTIDSVYVTGVASSFFADIQNGDNRVKVELASSPLPSGTNFLGDVGAWGDLGPLDQFNLTNSDPLAVAVVDTTGNQFDVFPVRQVSGAADSVVILSGTITAVTSITNSVAANIVDSSGVAYSGSNPVPITGTVTGVTNSLAVVALDRDGNPLTTGPIGQGDSATALRVVMAGDIVSSVIVNSGTITAVTSITNSVASALIDSSGVQYSTSNPLPIGDAGGSVTIDGTLTGITNAIEVRQVSGAINSVSVIDIFGSVATNVVNPDGRLKVELPTGSSGLTDTELRASHLDVQQVSGSIDSVYVTGASGTLATNIVDSSGIAYSGSNPVPSTMTTTLDSVNDSIGVLQVSGTIDSTQAKLIARTTNPTASTDGTSTFATSDKLGRQLIRPLQVRDLIKTAYVALSTGTETTLLSGTAATYNDLIMITATNNSTVATQLDIRAVTGGNIIHTMYLPASTGPVGFSPSVPWPQDATGNNWTIDMPDQTGTTVYVSALFSNEI
jgi:hypothetical protein